MYNRIYNIVNNLHTKDITVVVRKSQTTESVYVELYKNNIDIILRISDHLNKKVKCKQLIICKNTKNKNIERFIRNNIERINVISLMRKIENVNEISKSVK